MGRMEMQKTGGVFYKKEGGIGVRIVGNTKYERPSYSLVFIIIFHLLIF